jgi:hypothetical protein
VTLNRCWPAWAHSQTFWSLIHTCELSQTPPTYHLHWFIIQVRLGMIWVHLLRVWASSGTRDCVSYGIACYSQWLSPPKRLGAAEEFWHELVIVCGHSWWSCEGFLGLFPIWAPKTTLVNCSCRWVPSFVEVLAAPLSKSRLVTPISFQTPKWTVDTTGTSLTTSNWTPGEKSLCFHLVFFYMICLLSWSVYCSITWALHWFVLA